MPALPLPSPYMGAPVPFSSGIAKLFCAGAAAKVRFPTYFLAVFMKIRNVFLFVTLFAPLFCRAEVPGLPEEVSLALAAAGLPESSLSATVAPLDGTEGFRLS